MEDAGDYGAYKLAGYNSDVEDYDEPKFAHFKLEPKKSEQLNEDFEILPQSQFRTKNLNEALTDFQTKDWSKCRKAAKGDMTCYYCKDAKGATQEECMFISSSNPKNLKVERHESRHYDNNSRRTTAPSSVEVARPLPLKATPIASNKREAFARLRMGRPLRPTRASLINAEPLVTPKIDIDPNNFSLSDPSLKKTIKRTATFKRKVSDGFHEPDESRVGSFESFVNHE